MRKILRNCGLSADDATKKPSALSGGMQRQLGTARALAVPAHLVILDEAFAALDPESKTAMAVYVESELQNKLLLYVTHDEEPAIFSNATVIEL